MILYMLVRKISAKLKDVGAHSSTKAPLHVFPTLIVISTLNEKNPMEI